MIRLQLTGNLGKDCTLNTVNGKNVINFTVAHTEKWKDAQGNQRENTIWIDCAWWLERTTIAQYLKKGQQVYVEGKPSVRAFTRNNGEIAASQVLNVTQLQLMGKASAPAGGGDDGGSAGTNSNERVPLASEITEPIDDLPF